MKKIVFGAVFCSFFATFFSSCDKIESFMESKEEGKKIVPIEIWYSPYSSSAAPLPADWFALPIIEEKLGIKLKAVPLPAKKEEQNDVILKAARSGSLPDFFMVNRDVLVQLVKENRVARLDSMFKLMPVRSKQMYNAESKKNATFDGAIYGLSQPGSIDKNEGILIRKDWLDNLGLKIPRTLDEFFAVMQAFTFGDPDKNGKADTFGYGAFIELNNHEEGLGCRFSPFFGAFGVAGTFNASRDSLGLNVRKAEAFDAMAFIRKMVEEKVIDPNWSVYKKDDFREAWKNGRFGIMREQNAAFALEANYRPFDERFPNGEWILIDPPEGPDGKKSVGCYTQSYRTFAVSRRSEELGKLPALARLLEWMSGEGYNIVNYGKEGENFLLDSEGRVTIGGLSDPSKAYSKNEIAPILQLRNLVSYASDEELRARYPTWRTKNGKEMSALVLLRQMQNSPWTASVGVPVPPQELRVFYEQALLDFATGKRNLTRSNWLDFVSEFDKKGGAEWEKQCKAFVEENNLFVD